MPNDTEHKERLDRIYLTQDQLLKIVQSQAADSHALRGDVKEIKESIIGTLDNPGGLAGVLRDTAKAVTEHGERLDKLEESQDKLIPIVASHKSRRRDWATVKGVVIGAAALTGWEWVKGKFTGVQP